jgi:hypothetical protein
MANLCVIVASCLLIGFIRFVGKVRYEREPAFRISFWFSVFWILYFMYKATYYYDIGFIKREMFLFLSGAIMTGIFIGLLIYLILPKNLTEKNG